MDATHTGAVCGCQLLVEPGKMPETKSFISVPSHPSVLQKVKWKTTTLLHSGNVLFLNSEKVLLMCICDVSVPGLGLLTTEGLLLLPMWRALCSECSHRWPTCPQGPRWKTFSPTTRWVPGLCVQFGHIHLVLSLDIEVHCVLFSKGFSLKISRFYHNCLNHIFKQTMANLLTPLHQALTTNIFKTCMLTFSYNLPFSLGSYSQEWLDSSSSTPLLNPQGTSPTCPLPCRL